jgi:negative regulator of flagellin synthesis FlgM
MKIDPTSKINPPSVVQDEQRVRARQAEAGQAEAKARGEVQISPLSAQLKEIETQLETTQAVDTARVAEVKRAIAEGRFEVNSEKVADRLIESTREFLLAHKS